MNRSAFRSAIASALTSTFALVTQGRPDTFNGAATVAVIESAGIARTFIARDLYEDINSVAVTLYIERDAAGNATAESTLDTKILAAIAAIAAIDTTVTFAPSDALPGGTPARRIDGKVYRVERVICAIPEEG